ncbi:hypothetical protein O181_111514 [Austropuccinia psidii MF-1]|uniref:Peptidase A2 domain-containing protein n=1 Tax=Austropuccinia psidii MF-1 TaxID=1389203 RepID=A0A9Q3K088_9BASI|nr:hypothetical protein [Austropuccinia psidii MF-1]
MSLKSINSQEQTTTQEIIIQDKMQYSFPLRMIEVLVGQEGHIVKALVDSGAELSIIPGVEFIEARLPMRVLNRSLKGIGGHSTAIVGLSENTLLVLPSGDERRIHFFVARGAVHTVIRRGLISDNGIRLEHSQQQGEMLSYKESDGRRLCIPICTPESKEWHTGPPRGIELCNATQIEEWKINHTINIRRFEELPQGNSRKEENQVPIKQNPEIHFKNSKAEVTSNVLKISTNNDANPNYPQSFENTYSSNMEASTPVELVQKKGLQPKQLVNSVSPVCGKNGFHFNRKQNPVSEFYKPYVEAIFSKPKHSISPMDLLRVTSGASIKFIQNLFNKFKKKRMQEKLKEYSPVENHNQNNEQINSYLSYNNSI